MVSSKFIAKFNFVSNIIILLILVLGGFIWADTNGIWHRAEDVRAGIFGADEGSGDFTFPNNVLVIQNLNTNNSLCIKGICQTSWDFVVKSNQVCNDGKAVVGFDSTGGIMCNYPNAVYK